MKTEKYKQNQALDKFQQVSDEYKIRKSLHTISILNLKKSLFSFLFLGDPWGRIKFWGEFIINYILI